MTRPTHLIRPAQDEDLPVMAALLAQLLKSDPEITPDLEVQTRGLKAILSSQAVLLVLELEQKVVGMVSLQSSISTGLGCEYGLVNDFVIHSELTGQGWGEVLLEAVLKAAEQQNFPHVTLMIEPSNANAFRFVGRQGFCASTQVPMVYEL